MLLYFYWDTETRIKIKLEYNKIKTEISKYLAKEKFMSHAQRMTRHKINIL